MTSINFFESCLCRCCFPCWIRSRSTPARRQTLRTIYLVISSSTTPGTRLRSSGPRRGYSPWPGSPGSSTPNARSCTVWVSSEIIKKKGKKRGKQANQNNSSLFLLLLVLGLFPLEPINIGFLGTRRKWAKEEANVISYFLMTIEWHP